ncbi:unnamed protein product, partial [Dovyalis caffra]
SEKGGGQMMTKRMFHERGSRSMSTPTKGEEPPFKRDGKLSFVYYTDFRRAGQDRQTCDLSKKTID